MSKVSESEFESAAELDADLEAERLALLELLLEEEAEEAASATTAEAGVAIGHAAAPERIPLSLSQRRLWLADRLDPGTALFNIPASQRLSGVLDRRALHAALQALVDRHESLRTTFSTGGSEPGGRGSSEGFQVIARRREVELPRIDLSLLTLPVALQTALRLSGREQARGFDLERGPLLRFALVEMAPDDNVLLTTMHHIIADGWSLTIFQRELAALYAGFARNQPAHLPPLPIQYADFALWQRNWLRGEVLERQLAFWREHLADAPFLAELPTDRPRPRVRNFRGAKVVRLVADSVTEAFHRLARGEGVTYFASALALGHAWLGRLSGSDDALIGSPIAGRHRIETEGVIGFFVSNLVFRAQLRGDPTARELLVRTREETLAIQSHQDVPFDLLVEALAPERDLSTTPIYQVQLMAFDVPRRVDAAAHAAAEEAARVKTMGDLGLSPLLSGDELSLFDLSMSVAEGGRRLALQYNSDLFDPATIERFVAYFENLMVAFVAEPDRHFSEIAMIGEDERRQLLLEWNPPFERPEATGGFRRETLLPEWVAAHAASSPGAIAVEMGEARLTYAELEARSNALARYLAMFGVGPEVRVGLCLERSLDLVVGLIAVQKAGGAYLPLDPSYPLDRLAGMIEDAGLMLLLAHDATLDALPASTAYVINLDRSDEMSTMMGEAADAAPLPGPAPEHLAYVIYTSGSTGKPKGVMLAHDGLANLCEAQAEIFAVGPTSRVLQFASISFDASVAEIAVALCAGATLVLGRSDELLPGPGLVRLLKERRITKATIPPSALAVLPAGAESELPDLATLVVAGEACAPELAAKWSRGRRFVNAYGPTEATVCAATEVYAEGRALTLGGPLGDVEIHVLGPRFEPLPAGVAGELLIGGRGLARGYLNRPDLSAERFVPHPFAAERHDSGARLYRTGDLVRRLADGRVEFLGRIDHQVKVRGFRIELGEIEAALRAQAGVKDVVVLARNDSGGNADRLVAYLLAEPERELVPAELKAALAARLPDYMVPAAFVTLAAFPLTPNGKIDRQALPAPELAHLHVAGVRYEAPRDAIETLVAEVFAEVLSLAGEISIHDSFFDLGGHSLLATQLLSRVRDAFGVELPLRQVFEAQTVASFARAVEAAQREARGLESGPIERRPRVPGADLPLSFAQERLWFLDQLEPGSPTYNIPSALRVRGALDPARLKAALRYLERRHESLRTTFPTRAGRAVQSIASPDSPRESLLFARVDLASLAVARREVETLRLAGTQAIRPFDLGVGPLGRVVLAHLEPGVEQALLLTVHHVISDGWSMGVFVRELAEVHSALVEGREPDPKVLPPLPIQYADFAAWQRDWLTGEVLARQVDHWRRHLLGAPELLALPTDRPRPAVQSYRGASVARPSAHGSVERLHAFSRAEGATLFMTLLAAWSTLLYRYTGQTDIPIGTPIANRNRAEVEGLIGFFVNTLVLRTRVMPLGSFRSLLTAVRESTLEGYAHQDLPFEKLVEAIAPQRNLSYSPLFQSMLVLQNNPDRPMELPGIEITGLAMSGEVSKYDLTLNAIELGSRLACRVVYSSALFEPATVERILGHLHALLEALLDQPDRPVGTLDIFSPEERRALLVEWNEPAVAHSSEGYLPQMFESQVDAGPSRVAVEFDDRGRSAGFSTLTYAELDERANRLARYLRAAGVGPEVRVGVCLERSLDLPVALLAVLKAGAAYLPLDPSLPEDRLRYLVADAAAPVVVTVGRFVERLGAAAASALRLVLLDDAGQAAAIAAESSERLLPAALGLHPAYVIYTSGSTGQPKGVVVSHRALGNRLRYAIATDFPTDAEAFLQKTTISFDVSVLEIFAPLVSGGRTVLPEPEGHRDPAYLVRLIAERRITQASFPPSTLALLLDSGALDECRDLRLLVTGGETVPADLPSRVHERLPWIDVYNRYGPTEATISVTSWLCRPDKAERSLPIGRPTASARVYLLDREGEPTPPGVAGELHLGGLCLARGYLDRPALTAAAFVPDPFATEPGERLYRTGDLAKWRVDGAIEFVGRIDGQIKIRGFRVELGEIEAALHAQAGVREVAVIDRQDVPGQKRLVAYVVAEADAPADLLRALRERLAAELPAYMVPAAFVALEALPLAPTGKVDRKALPAPPALPADTATVSGYAPPRTETETLLAGVWAEVLGLPRVGIHDNYFALGGDSILSIQIVARATQAGCRIAPRQLFQHQTVAELAAVAGTIEAVEAEQGPVVGEAPLSPIQRWFLASDRPDRHWFNQSFLLGLDRAVDPATIERAVAQLVEHHDALRLRFHDTEAGWLQELAPVGETPFEAVDLSMLPEAERRPALEATCAGLQASLDLAAGPILRAALFDLGVDEPRRLLLAIHHLAVDGVSWRILVEDLESALAGRALPAKTTSWKAWTEKLAALGEAFEGADSDEAAFWLREPVEEPLRLPIDPRAGNLVASARSVAVSFDAEETQRLLKAPSVYRAQLQDLLLAALVPGLAWPLGASAIRLELEGHGREEELVPDVDLTRTVGWFTATYPLLLEASPLAAPGDLIRAAKESLRRTPKHGLGYGILRFMTAGETARQLADLPPPEISFNYLGQADAQNRDAGRDGAASPRVSMARENPGPTLSPRATRAHELAISAVISGGSLRVEMMFAEGRLGRELVEALAESFKSQVLALAEHCAEPEAGGPTPSDFPLAGLDAESLAKLCAELPDRGRGLEEVYPLSPLQEGFVFQTLAAPRSGVYCEQLAATLEGDFDDPAFVEAMRRLIARHPVMRTSFRWQGVPRLLQLVQAQVEPRIALDDWRHLGAAESEQRFAALLEEDRRRGFALDQAPLFAARLIRTADDRRRLVLANHHIVLDGWSYQPLMGELFALYAGVREGREVELALRRPYRDYIAWIAGQDKGAADAFWRRTLAGVTEPTPLMVDRPALRGFTGLASGDVERMLDRDETGRLEALARREQVTLNTVVQGAVGLLFARNAGREDVVFGSTVSGRPPELAGVESMLGLFINTLPTRVATPPAERVGAWLRNLQEQQTEMRQFEHSSLLEIQAASEIENGRPLFESILVFENYPRETAVAAGGGEAKLMVGDVQFRERNNLALTLVAAPLDRLVLRASFDADRLDEPTAARLLDQLVAILHGLVELGGEARLAEVPHLPAAERSALLAAGLGRFEPDEDSSLAAESLAGRLARRAAERPDAPAILWDGAAIGYAELDRRSNALARALRARGVGPEVAVGLCFERSPDLVVAIFGVMRAGGAFVPLDPSYPKERLAFQLADAGVRLVLAAEPFHGLLGELLADREAAEVLAPAALAPGASGGLDATPSESAPPPSESYVADLAAYILYTSGSTGRPKGVVVTHRGLVELGVRQSRRFGVGPESRVLQFASPAFDAAVAEIAVAVTAGAALVMAEKSALLPGPGLVRLLRRERVTKATLPPSALAALPAGAESELPDLANLVVAGEACPPALARRWAAGRRFLNAYGPTEATVCATIADLSGVEIADGSPLPLGEPLPHARVHVVDRALDPAGFGIPGELLIGGAGLARGYWGRPDLTAERFVPDPFAAELKFPAGGRLYRSGDLARRRADGALEFLGRIDSQVKVRGFRVELEEIETALGGHPEVAQAAVALRPGAGGEPQLVGYVVAGEGAGGDLAARLRAHLAARLPEHMVPSAIVFLAALPLSPTGKVDRRALPDREEPRAASEGVAAEGAASASAAPATGLEAEIAAIWRDALGVSAVGLDDNFFDLGGQSLLILQVQARLEALLGRDLEITDLFKYPTIRRLAAFLSGGASAVEALSLGAAGARAAFATAAAAAAATDLPALGNEPIAIVGMAGRFPQATDLEEFWHNLAGGVESVRFFTPEELRAAGVGERAMAEPGFVAARASLEDVDRFDAEFFQITPREAEILDPQHRLFLECAWEALENAGYDAEAYAEGGGRIGLWAGVSTGDYLMNVLSDGELVRSVGMQQLMLGSKTDFLPTRVSYKLDLRGPSMAIQTACSTSLVTAALACESLLAGHCEMALAGGVSITASPAGGYVWQEGGILSADGHCRAFDERASGTIGGNGVGVVVLKRLSRALADGDHIHALVRGWGLNNDGHDKVGYMAPSVAGQTLAIRSAQAMAGVPLASIGYVEAHGTGTPIGDPIEIKALGQAFGPGLAERSIAIGTVKSNIGHLDAAAGVAGLIKTTLALLHRQIPPSLHFVRPNPRLELAGSPFYVAAELGDWPAPAAGGPRRAGVSSFGIGGTNAHLVLEEAPAREVVPEARAPRAPREIQILPLSARSDGALLAASDRLAAHLENPSRGNEPLADTSWTLQVGRKPFARRRAVLARSAEEAAQALRSPSPDRVFDAAEPARARRTAFLFPGQGAQRPGMAGALYASEPAFRAEVDRACELLRGPLGLDLRDLLFPAPGDAASADEAARRLERTENAQPALFVIEHALARLLLSWGIEPAAMLGHSIGEYVAACLAGVFSLEDALALVAVRGRLMGALPEGAMLSVPLGELELSALAGPDLDVAALNGPARSVVSGPVEAIDALVAMLDGMELATRRLRTSHAFHSAMMEPMLDDFRAAVAAIERRAPARAWISNLTGSWITAEEAVDPEYWAAHLRNPVRFGAGIETLVAAHPDLVLLEVGPGTALSTLARRHPAIAGEEGVETPVARPIVSLLPEGDGELALAQALARLWLAGVPIDWAAYRSGEAKRRTPLPTYPFERERFWIERRLPEVAAPKGPRDVTAWLHRPIWSERAAGPARPTPASRWLIFQDDGDGASKLARHLEAAACEVIEVRAGSAFKRVNGGYHVRPGRADDIERLFAGLGRFVPDAVVHLWSRGGERPGGDEIARGFATLLPLARALGRLESAVELIVVASGTASIDGEPLVPARGAIVGLLAVAAQENPDLSTRIIDLPIHRAGKLAGLLLAELGSAPGGLPVALRGDRRFERSYLSLAPGAAGETAALRYRPEGVYLITGGLGKVGALFAERIARRAPGAKLALTARTPLPPRAEWERQPAGSESAARIARVQALEALGAEVLVLAVDAADRAATEAALADLHARFGALSGIVHAAGQNQRGLGLIADLTAEDAAAQLAPKLLGVSILEELLAGRPLDFFLAVSSLAGTLGGLGFGAYAAANSALDLWAEARSMNGVAAASVAWDGFRFDAAAPAAEGKGFLGISPAEADAVLAYLETGGAPHLVVATGDLAARIDQSLKRRPERKAGRGGQTRPASRGRFEPPAGAAERTIATIWTELLGIAEVGRSDNFFELGGDSLLAIQVAGRLKKAGLPATAQQLLALPTIAELAAALGVPASDVAQPLAAEGPRTAPPSVLVPIQTPAQGSVARPPLFAVHPVGGTVFFYRDLARALGPDQPVWGLQARGLEGEAEPIANLKEMAAFYLDAIETLGAPGPLHLVGSSLGGTVAFEIARQARARGRKVGLVGLLDTPGWGQIPPLEGPGAALAMIEMLGAGRLRMAPETLAGLSPEEQVDRIWQESEAQGVVLEGFDRERLGRLHGVIRANMEAMFGYPRQRYDGRLLYARARDRRPGEPANPELPWLDAAAEGVEFHVVPGDHTSMNRAPNVARLAEILARRMGE